ncbi:hypothetical protein [Photobacterium nomapromontoriensis]|uniref:hypothetical protein n=1 Tax=Photobacterium nomapromontoriensis TaxID=2910237 RepID=UPI003D127885
MSKRAGVFIVTASLFGSGFVQASVSEITPLSPAAGVTPIQAPTHSPLPQLLPLDPTLSTSTESTLPAFGETFSHHPKLIRQAVEFYGEGRRPVDNSAIDRHSVYQNKNTVSPTEFGAGVKFNATDNFSISVEAGGELETDDTVDIDTGAVKFNLSY